MTAALPWHYHLPVIRLSTLACGMALAALAAGGGCAREAAAPGDEGLVAPVVRGAQAGLELRIWVLREGPDASEASLPLAAALGPYLGTQGVLGPGDKDLWAANGLRLVSVPLDRLGTVQAALGSPGAVQRQWLGEHPDWMELVRGPQTARQVVKLDSGLMTLDPGRLRLLGRCWVSPRLPGSGAAPLAEVRVDLALQHLGPPRTRSLRELVDQPQRTPIEQIGVVFSRFVLELGLPPDQAILIVPERPDVDWNDAAPAEEPVGVLAGPPAPYLPTLGESMLWSDSGVGPSRPVRIIIALIPHLPERVEIAAAPAVD